MRKTLLLSILAAAASPVAAAESSPAFRRAIVHDFSSGWSHENSFAVDRRASVVAAAMTSDFEKAATEDPVAPASNATFVRGVPSPNFVRVPKWMRSGVAAGSLPTFSAATISLRGCADNHYRPSGLLGRTAEQRRQILYPLVQQAACRAGVPLGLFDALLMQESRYNPGAISPKGAFGLGQLMPGTARMLGVNPYDIRSNLWGSASYLKNQLSEFGRYDLALAAYNAGPGRVRKVGRVPNITETRGYVSIILRNWLHLEKSRI